MRQPSADGTTRRASPLRTAPPWRRIRRESRRPWCQHGPPALGVPEPAVKVRGRKVKEPALCYRLDDLLIDTGARRVTRNGIDLGVTGLSFDLLLALGRVAPNLLSTEALIESVWPKQVVSTETLTQRVKLLRQQLEDDAANPRYVASRRGYGYRLVSKLMPASASSATPGPYHQAHELLLQARVIMRGTHES